MAKTASYIPDGYHSVTLYLIIEGAETLIEFMVEAFDGVEVVSDRSINEDGSIQHAAVRVSGSIIELSEAREAFPAMPAMIHLYVPDVDAKYEKAIAAGATSIHEVMDMPYGERSGGVKDLAGNLWFIATADDDR